VAVGADQDAFFGLTADLVNRPGDPPPGETKRLGIPVDMMEVKGSLASVIATQQALSAPFLDEQRRQVAVVTGSFRPLTRGRRPTPFLVRSRSFFSQYWIVDGLTSSASAISRIVAPPSISISRDSLSKPPRDACLVQGH
jgi:hypothetical protein